MQSRTLLAAPSVHTSSMPSLPPPSPKSAPDYPDLYGKRREMAKVQMLEREITFLQEELKSVEGIQTASRCCKEIAEFMVANSDPLVPTKRKKKRSCPIWKWLCQLPCFCFSWICCCCQSGCLLHLGQPSCRACNPCSCFSSLSCSTLNCRFCHSLRLNCFKSSCCCQDCCISKCSSCPGCFCSPCCRCKCSCPQCPEVCPCCLSTKSCCNPCSLCF